MTEKTLKHELYKHGSYLHSLKESGSNFVNIDDEIKKLEELFQLASKKDHHPPFAVGEYYSTREGMIFQVINEPADGHIGVKFLVKDEMICNRISIFGAILKNKKPATVEQIATFRRAEQFAKHGRKLDEFLVGDLVKNKECQIGNVQEVTRGGQVIVYFESKGVAIEYLKYSLSLITLIQTAEELQEVGDE